MTDTQATAIAVTGKAALFAALSRAQKECRTAELDGRFEGGKVRYPFTSAQERMAVARDALGKHGLALVRVGMPELRELSMSRELIDTTTGATTIETYGQRLLEVRYLLVHEGGESLELGSRWPVMEGPGRPLDKAWASADTSGLSYLIRDVLLIPSEESEDLREREGSGGKIVQMPSRPPAPVPTVPIAAPAKATITPTQPVATEAAKRPVSTATNPPAAASAPPAPAAGPSSPPQQDAVAKGVAGGPPSETAAAVPTAAPSAPAAPPAPSPGLALPSSGPDVFDGAIAEQGGPVSELFAAEQRAKEKLAAAPLLAAKLYARQATEQDKAIYLEVFAVAEKRFGSRERAIAAVKELGVPQGTVPTVGQLRQFVEVMS